MDKTFKEYFQEALNEEYSKKITDIKSFETFLVWMDNNNILTKYYYGEEDIYTPFKDIPLDIFYKITGFNKLDDIKNIIKKEYSLDVKNNKLTIRDNKRN